MVKASPGTRNWNLPHAPWSPRQRAETNGSPSSSSTNSTKVHTASHRPITSISYGNRPLGGHILTLRLMIGHLATSPIN
jgi:hypothetical protein